MRYKENHASVVLWKFYEENISKAEASTMFSADGRSNLKKQSRAKRENSLFLNQQVSLRENHTQVIPWHSSEVKGTLYFLLLVT